MRWPTRWTILRQTLLGLTLVAAVGPAAGQPLANPLRAETPTPTPQPQPQPQQPINGEDQAAAKDEQQNGATNPQREVLTTKQLEERLTRVGTLNLSEVQAGEAKSYYQDALQLAAERDVLLKKAGEKEALYQPIPIEDEPNAPPRYSKAWYEAALRQPIAELLNLQQFEQQRAPTDFLEERATTREEYVTKWSKIVKDLEAAPAIRKQFLSNFPAKKQAIEQLLAETAADLDEIATDGIANEVTEARRVALNMREAKLQAELAALKAERAAVGRGEKVYDLELELANRKAAAYTAALALVRNELSQRRKQAVNVQVREAERDANLNKQLIDEYPDSLGALSEYNQALTKELKTLLQEDEQVTAEIDATTEANNSVASKFKSFQSKFGEDAKLSQAGGQLLRDERASLPRVAQLKGELLKRTNQKNDISFRRFDANQRLQELNDREAAVARVLEGVPADDRAHATPVVQTLLASQQDYLDSYTESLSKLEARLGELISVKEQLRDNTDEFREFIAQRDLWIRSCRPLWASQVQLGEQTKSWQPFYLKPAFEAAEWTFRPSNWLAVFADLQAAVLRQPLPTVMLIVAFLLLLYAQRNARGHIRLLGSEAAKKNCTEFRPSLRALWLTLAVSVPWPLLLWGIGWLLDSPLTDSDFALALSQSIRVAAGLLLLTEFLRQCCRTDGLAEAHLGWPRAALLQLRRYLRWVPVLIVPLVLWMVGLDVQTSEPLWSASLGRVLFLIVLAYAALTLWRLLMSPSSAIYQLLDRGTENWLLNAHRVWRPAVVVLPVALGVMATLGYYYTAEQLAKRVLATAAMLLCLMIAGGLLRRWVLLNRRKLAREQARQRRAQAQAATTTDGAEMSSLLDVADETVDLTALSEQTRKLLRMVLLVGGVLGAVAIWADVFPALAWLDENKLPWATGDDPTSWGNLLRSLGVLVITYIAARDLPSLLELVVLQHLPIDQGARYAVATLGRYTLLIIGIMVAAAALGITGTSISWLVAAMGVGLGFGLQEIFANFVSGIILLFERPIRVGDIITLGDKTGMVSRIRMRATTITDWDRKEYVVPNKDLVTERLLNWTLSDQLNRITLVVGVAYGSDTERATELLHQIIAEHPLVMEDPVPRVTFDGFADSTLNLTIRCFLPDLEHRLDTIHELHTTINKRFNEAGIEIAFPQRDLHIRSVPPNWEQRPPADASSTNGRHESPTKADLGADV